MSVSLKCSPSNAVCYRLAANVLTTESSALTTDDAEAGLEAVVGALQPELMVHLGVDVLQRRQSRTTRVTVVPAHQRQAAHEQVLTDLKPVRMKGE